MEREVDLLQGAEGVCNHPDYKKPTHYDMPKAKAAFLQNLSEEDREEYVKYHEIF